MERPSDVPVRKDKTDRGCEEKTDTVSPIREKRRYLLVALFAALSLGIGAAVWFMPSKIDEVVEGFDLGKRAATFRYTLPEPTTDIDNE